MATVPKCLRDVCEESFNPGPCNGEWMEGDELADDEEVTWVGYCPHPRGESCTKGQGQIKRCTSEAQARMSIFNHVQFSEHHRQKASWEQSFDMAQEAEIWTFRGKKEDCANPEVPQQRPKKRPRGGGGGRRGEEAEMWISRDGLDQAAEQAVTRAMGLMGG